MSTLVIYDSTGYILSATDGSAREPVGIPFIWVEIPIGKRLKITDDKLALIDVSVTPNVAILEDIPLTEMEIMQADQLLQASRSTQMEEDNEAFQSYVEEMIGGM